MKTRLSAFSLVILVLVPGVAADSPARDDAFAEHLQREREYYRAVTEYMRLLHADPGNTRAALWKTNMLASFAAGDRVDEALDWAGRWAVAGKAYAPGESQPVLYPLGLALENRRYDFPLMLRGRGIVMEDSAESARLARGTVIALAATGRVKAVDSALQARSDWDSAFIAATADALNPPYKDAQTARLLSFFPGGGYFYTEKPGTGTASFFIVSLLGYAMFESIRNDQIALATAIGLFNFAWYTGSISVTSKLVEEWNGRQRQKVLLKLHNHF
jgi:hypothetical protein